MIRVGSAAGDVDQLLKEIGVLRRRVFVGQVLGCAALLLFFFAGLQPAKVGAQAGQKQTLEELRVSRLVIVDAQGRERGAFGMEGNDALLGVLDPSTNQPRVLLGTRGRDAMVTVTSSDNARMVSINSVGVGTGVTVSHAKGGGTAWMVGLSPEGRLITQGQD